MLKYLLESKEVKSRYYLIKGFISEEASPTTHPPTTAFVDQLLPARRP
jgi:hypothetical protein